jgi:cytosine/uracil/thiamine/allantoin permease
MPHISPPPPSLLRKIKSSSKYATSGGAVVTPEPLASDRRVIARASTVLSAVLCNAQTLFYLTYFVGLFLSDVVFKCLEQIGDNS